LELACQGLLTNMKESKVAGHIPARV
jgi:hypothetical protein